MNKPIQIQQNTSKQAAQENRVNRNLSPSLARIQTLACEAAPSHSETTADKKEGIPQAHEPKFAITRPSEAKDLPAEPKGSAPNTFQSPSPTAQHHTPASGSTQITPWIIASITLTLALFSGNYAWRTQQQVETLSLRLEQLETQTITSPSTGLQESNDNLVKIEQALLTLKQTQGQQASTISVLQNNFTTGTEQTQSRLIALKDDLAGLTSQAQLALLHQEAPPVGIGKEPSLTQISESKNAAGTTITTANGERDGVSKNGGSKNVAIADNASTKKWSINIASFSDPSAASSVHQKVQKIADTASITPVMVNGKTLYRIRAEGYGSREGAEHEALTLQTQLGLSGLWVSRD